MGKKQLIAHLIETQRPINEIWNGLLTPEPFPGNLFIKDETTYVCYPLGTGNIGGYRFDFGNQKWLIIRLSRANLDRKEIQWDLVDIKKSPLKHLEISVKLESHSITSKIQILLTAEYKFPANVFKFFFNRSLKKRMSTFVI